MKKLVLLACLAVAAGANAQTYPTNRPISIVVPFAAGGPTDRVARDLAEAMRKAIPGSNFVVENAAGAGGTIGANKVAKAAPDGQTLLLFHVGMATTPVMYRKLTYKPLEDFEYLGIVNDVPMTLIGKPQLPANTYRDFENYIRANAGKLNLAHAGQGSASHLCGLMWQSAVKLNESMTTIPFGGTAPAMNALVGGQVDVMCDQTTNTVGQIEGGRVKAFAVTTARPLSGHKTLKDYPTLQEMGLKGFNLTIWHGLYAPKGTPAAITKILNEGMKKALKDPDFIKKQEGLGAIVATDNRVTPEGHKAFVAAEINKIRPVFEAAKAFAD
ncbi:MAG: tripartite tricarboxylate transporter substrate binding protein BugD [Burkholderiaceae bacterium]|jgi:tripartite-type tricarboxylate transporter receptor subunit TctC|nr:tripartite tricarboxylate transporter substrate binding protein BugD [Burkholderiaceae bacterium]